MAEADEESPLATNEWDYLSRKSDNWTHIATTAIRFGSFCVLAVCLYAAVASLAGKATFADIGVRVLGDFKVSQGIAWIFGASGVGYGLRERRLRRQVNKRLGGRVSYLEGLLDPGRSSSELTGEGQTNPEDE